MKNFTWALFYLQSHWIAMILTLAICWSVFYAPTVFAERLFYVNFEEADDMADSFISTNDNFEQTTTGGLGNSGALSLEEGDDMLFTDASFPVFTGGSPYTPLVASAFVYYDGGDDYISIGFSASSSDDLGEGPWPEEAPNLFGMFNGEEGFIANNGSIIGIAEEFYTPLTPGEWYKVEFAISHRDDPDTYYTYLTIYPTVDQGVVDGESGVMADIAKFNVVNESLLDNEGEVYAFIAATTVPAFPYLDNFTVANQFGEYDDPAPPVISATFPVPGETYLAEEWAPEVSWGLATFCGYAYEDVGLDEMEEVDCEGDGSDILSPETFGAASLFLKALISFNEVDGAVASRTIPFTFSDVIEEEETPSRSSGSSSGGRSARYCSENDDSFCRSRQSNESAETVKDIIEKYRETLMKAHDSGIVLPTVLLDLLGLPTTIGGNPDMSVRDLFYGLEGDDVRALQNVLIGQGYAIPAGATGYFLEQTRTALVAYQTANNVTPSAGYFGALTRASMKSKGIAGLWW